MRETILINIILWTLFACASANVEKRIFLAPGETTIPQNQLNLDQLHLETLTPARPILRRQLKAAFPTGNEPQGPASWFLLDSLSQHQRYEIRVCWLATVSSFMDIDRRGQVRNHVADSCRHSFSSQLTSPSTRTT